jgi:hypothetical protein
MVNIKILKNYFFDGGRYEDALRCEWGHCELNPTLLGGTLNS